jgi:hypothetical protein
MRTAQYDAGMNNRVWNTASPADGSRRRDRTEATKQAPTISTRGIHADPDIHVARVIRSSSVWKTAVTIIIASIAVIAIGTAATTSLIMWSTVDMETLTRSRPALNSCTARDQLPLSTHPLPLQRISDGS